MGTLMMASTVSHVVLQVADLGRSVAYYTREIGFDLLENSGGIAKLGPRGGPLLLELRERPGARAVPKHGRLGLYHFAILVPDRAALGRFLSDAFRRGVQPGMADHLVSEALYLWDPDGLGIEVYRDRPREEWPRDRGHLVMASDPLDVQGVVHAGAGKPWDGLPSGTVIGHMHLHVSDLDRAAEFYRDGLGLDVTHAGYPGALFMSYAGYHHHLGVNTWARRAPRAGDDDARLLEWTLTAPGAEENAEVLVDPDGTTVRVKRPRPAR
jgi:catechol 2,3-dioxygenase